MDTESLVNAVKNKDVFAQKYLYDKFADPMFLFCRRYIAIHEDAEEVLLNGFYRIFANINSFEWQGEGAFRKWVKKIMLHESLRFLNQKNAFTIVPESDVAEIPVPESAPDNLAREEIFKMIIQLPVGYRTVFNLYVVEGMEHAEIAEALKISVSTSKTQLFRAKRLLQKWITEINNYEKVRNK